MNKELKKLYIYMLKDKWPIKEIIYQKWVKSHRYHITFKGMLYIHSVYLTKVDNG